MKKFFEVLLILVFAVPVFAGEVNIVSSVSTTASSVSTTAAASTETEMSLWKEYHKMAQAVKDTDEAPFELQLETQQKKLAAAQALVTAEIQLKKTQGILSWQFNNMGKLYINQFEATANWTTLVNQLNTTTGKVDRIAIRKQMYDQALLNIALLDKAMEYLKSAEEWNTKSSDPLRAEKIANNIKYVVSVKSWIANYKGE